MKKTLALMSILLFVCTGISTAQTRQGTIIELNEDQVSIIIRNCPRDGEVTIDLTADQIAIIVHNYPQVEIDKLTLGPEHLRDDNTVELMLEGRTALVPVEAGRTR